MGQLGHPLLTEGAGQPLEGVGVAEHPVEQLRVGLLRSGLEEEQAPAQGLGGLGGLGGELRRRVLGAHASLRYWRSKAWR
jgi:hypothetical protein